MIKTFKHTEFICDLCKQPIKKQKELVIMNYDNIGYWHCTLMKLELHFHQKCLKEFINYRDKYQATLTKK